MSACIAGLCAERCPTAAWDMQKSTIKIPHARGREQRHAQLNHRHADRVNDFVVKFANVNGTGSASANSLIMKAIFRMGVPVTGKNYFPSNIQGLPTWYEIRVTRDGYAARAGRVDIMVAMNAETYSKDVREVASGGYLIYDATWPRSTLLQRGDITVIGVPLAQLVNENFDGVRNRILLKNIAYAGVLAALLDLDLEVIDGLMKRELRQEAETARVEHPGAAPGIRLCQGSTCSCPLPLRVEHLDKTRGHIMIDGNTAAGLGCVYAGATVGAWYPITPSTSLMDAFKGFCERYRVDPADRRAQFRGDPGRGRTGRHRHGARRELERRARLHADERPGYLADERIRRARLLRRSAVRDFRRAAGRTLDRHADAHAAVGSSCCAPMPRTATPAMCCCSPRIRRNASTWRCRRSTSPSVCRRRCSCCRTSTSA